MFIFGTSKYNLVPTAFIAPPKFKGKSPGNEVGANKDTNFLGKSQGFKGLKFPLAVRLLFCSAQSLLYETWTF